MLKLASPHSDHATAARSGGCSTNPYLWRNLDCGSGRAETLKLALRNPITECRARGRLQRKPTAAAESPTREQARRC